MLCMREREPQKRLEAAGNALVLGWKRLGTFAGVAVGDTAGAAPWGSETEPEGRRTTRRRSDRERPCIKTRTCVNTPALR